MSLSKHVSMPRTEARPPRRPLPVVVERAAAGMFGSVAALRNRRGLHPKGIGFTGEAVLHDAGRSLAQVRELVVEARLSRGAGLPHPLPDFNGVAVRFVDARGPGLHQDLLFTASGRRPALRHLIVPVPYLSWSGYSTVLPYKTPTGQRRVFRCDPLTIPTLASAEDATPLRVEIRIARPLGAWEPAATVTLTSVLAADAGLRFDPWNTGPALTPSGVLNRLRAPAYAGSRAAAPLDRQ